MRWDDPPTPDMERSNRRFALWLVTMAVIAGASMTLVLWLAGGA